MTKTIIHFLSVQFFFRKKNRFFTEKKNHFFYRKMAFRVDFFLFESVLQEAQVFPLLINPRGRVLIEPFNFMRKIEDNNSAYILQLPVVYYSTENALSIKNLTKTCLTNAGLLKLWSATTTPSRGHRIQYLCHTVPMWYLQKSEKIKK